MQIPVFYPGKWSSVSKRIFKYTRYKQTPFCFMSFRYDEYLNLTNFKGFIAGCHANKLEKIYEYMWFFITQLAIFVKRHPICSAIYAICIVPNIIYPSHGILMLINSIWILLAIMVNTFDEHAGYVKRELLEIAKIVDEKLTKLEVSKDV